MADAPEEKAPIIVIKKGGHGGHGHHGGAWKVAFADFVTAMMALFMVLWLVGQSPKTKSAVGAYFRDPLGVAAGGSLEVATGPNRGGSSFFEGGNTAVAVDTNLSGAAGSASRSSKELPDLSNAKTRLAQALLQLKMDSWSRHVELTAVEDGLRIEVQDSEDLSLFPRGGTAINAAAEPLLSTIAEELALLPNAIVIEGHTDSSPARGKQTNWELSTDRANAARAFLAARGLRPDQVVEIRGYADRRPRLWHRPEDPRNRRISVLVLLRNPALQDEEEPALDPTKHPLIKRLRKVDVEAQGPGKELELDPAGDLQTPR